MHYSYFSDRIYVEKTQYCLDNRNSQKAKTNMDRYLSKGSDDQQVWDQDDSKGAI